MWTPATRRRHSRDYLRYETDLTDAEWALIETLLPAPSQRGRPRTCLREGVNAIFSVPRGGGHLATSAQRHAAQKHRLRLVQHVARPGSLRTAPMPGRAQRRPRRSSSRSSECLPIRSPSRFIPVEGWSSGSLPGSAGTGGCGRTPKRRSPRPEPSSMRLPSCSSSAGWDEPHDSRAVSKAKIE